MPVKRLLFYHTLLLGCGLLVAKTLSAAIGHSAAQDRFAEMHAYSVFFPEGWGFFTRSPREDKFLLYKVEAPGQALRLATYKNTSAANLGGLSRRSRRVSMEFHRLLTNVPATGWKTLPVAPEQLGVQLDSLPRTTVAFRANQLALLTRGEYVVRRYRVTPWAWAAYQQHLTPTADYTRLTIR